MDMQKSADGIVGNKAEGLNVIWKSIDFSSYSYGSRRWVCLMPIVEVGSGTAEICNRCVKGYKILESKANRRDTEPYVQWCERWGRNNPAYSIVLVHKCRCENVQK